MDVIFIPLDMGSLIAGTKYRENFEERIKEIVDGIREAGKFIVYIDESTYSL